MGKGAEVSASFKPVDILGASVLLQKSINRAHAALPHLPQMYALLHNKIVKTYNSGNSPMVTHLTTSPPVEDLTKKIRRVSVGFYRLWSYVENLVEGIIIVDVEC